MIDPLPPNEDAVKFNETTTAQKKRLFLHYLGQTCNITKSAELAGVDRTLVYFWREKDANFDAEFQVAKERGFERCEDEMHRRAYEGSVVATQSGIVRQYSDTLAIFLAKAHKPDRYNERVRNEISGPNGAALGGDETKITAKLNSILNAVMNRRNTVDSPADDPDYSDIV